MSAETEALIFVAREALYQARDALYRGEGPDLSADSDVVYGEWLGNRADALMTADHTADCPNRVADRAVVVAEALAAHVERPCSWTGRGKSAFWSECDGCDWSSDQEIQTSHRDQAHSDAHRAHVTAAILAALDGAPA